MLSFEDNAIRIGYIDSFFSPKVEMKKYNIVIDSCNLFDQLAKNNIRTYGNFDVGQGDACTTDCLLYYTYYKENYKLTSIDLSKQQPLDADPKAEKRINFTGYLKLCREYNDGLYYQRIQGSYLRFLTRTSESILKRLYELYWLLYLSE